MTVLLRVHTVAVAVARRTGPVGGVGPAGADVWPGLSGTQQHTLRCNGVLLDI
jgi:hypothetical protein